MQRINIVLASALVVQLGLIIVTHSAGRERSIREPEPILSELDPAKVTRLEISDSDSDSPLILEKKGEDWVIASHFDYPARASHVSASLSALAGMESRRPVARGEERFAQLGVAKDDFVRKVVAKSGEDETTLYIGTPAGRGKIAVRSEGEQDIHAQTGVRPSTLQADVTSWVDTSYLDVPAEDIASIEVSNEAGTFLIERGGEEPEVSANGKVLSPAPGTEIDQSLLDRLVSDAGSISLQEPVAPRPDETAVATAIVRTRGQDEAALGEEYIVDYYRDGDGFVVHERQRQQWVRVAPAEAESLVELEKETFFESAQEEDAPPQPPAPAPAGP